MEKINSIFDLRIETKFDNGFSQIPKALMHLVYTETLNISEFGYFISLIMLAYFDPRHKTFASVSFYKGELQRVFGLSANTINKYNKKLQEIGAIYETEDSAIVINNFDWLFHKPGRIFKTKGRSAINHFYKLNKASVVYSKFFANVSNFEVEAYESIQKTNESSYYI